MTPVLESAFVTVGTLAILLAASFGAGLYVSVARRFQRIDDAVWQAQLGVFAAVTMSDPAISYGTSMVGYAGFGALCVALPTIVAIYGRKMLRAVSRSTVLVPETGRTRWFGLFRWMAVFAVVSCVMSAAPRLGTGQWTGLALAASLAAVGAALGAIAVARAARRSASGQARQGDGGDVRFESLASRDAKRLEAMRQRDPESLRQGPPRVADVEASAVPPDRYAVPIPGHTPRPDSLPR